MADKGGDYFLETEEFDISQIILIQAALRGALVRKWMKEVKQAFEVVFNDIERNSAIGPDWASDQLCKPKVVRRKDRPKKEKLPDAPNKAKTGGKDHNTITSKSKTFKRGKRELSVTDPSSQTVAAAVKVSAEKDGSIDSELSDKDSPKFNSVEIQTSFIDVNFQSLPDKFKHNSDEFDDKDNNILDDLDTSWKDRVEPFIRNNFGEAENLVAPERDVQTTDELHLDLDLDAESPQSQRSEESCKQSSKGSDRHEGFQILNAKSDDDIRSVESASNEKLSKLETDETENDTRRSSRSGKSERSRNSSIRKYDQHEESVHADRSSYRSENKSTESQKRVSKRSPEYKERELSDGISSKSVERSDRDRLSNRSDKSTDRSHRRYETERFSPRGQRSTTSHNSDVRSQRSKGSEKGSEGELTHRSDISESRRQNSNRSDGSASHRSDKSEDRKSQRSQRSRQGESPSSQRSRQSESQRSQRVERVEKTHPQPSCVSPVQFQHPVNDPLNEESARQGRPPLQDSTSLTNVTSVWGSFTSVRDSHDTETPKPLPQDASQLKELRRNIAMELLWVQQAIDSRKNYLKLKGKM